MLRLKGSDALKQVVVDSKRGILYTRSEQGVVVVVRRRTGAKDAPRKVAEVKNVAQLAAQARRQGSLFAPATPSVKKGAKLVHIAVVQAEESSVVTLVAICADGRRTSHRASTVARVLTVSLREREIRDKVLRDCPWLSNEILHRKAVISEA